MFIGHKSDDEREPPLLTHLQNVAALAAGFAEPFGAAELADRFIVSLINRREVNKNEFTTRENGAITMDDATRKTVLTAWQTHKQAVITHPSFSVEDTLIV
jgi:CRISPR/Cas system-associated endonuclease Cas1